MTDFVINLQAPDPKLNELSKSLEREVRLEHKLHFLKIIFWSFVVIGLALLIYRFISAPHFWIFHIVVFTGFTGLLVLFYRRINQVKNRIDAEEITQKNLRLKTQSTSAKNQKHSHVRPRRLSS